MNRQEKFGRPVAGRARLRHQYMGAYPGVGAEQGTGVGAIARNLMEMVG